MPNLVSVASIVEKNKLGSDVPYLAFLDVGVLDPTTGTVSQTLYYVNNTEAVVRQGITYQPMQFSLELKTQAGAQPQVNVSIFDYTRAVIQTMNDYGGGTDFPVVVRVCQTGALNETPDVEEHFTIVQATADNYVANWTLGAENALTKQFPRRQQRRDFCQWVYRDGNTCRYNGAMTSCDRTLAGPLGCRAHNNVINFGGYPNLVSSNLYVA
jgi:phage-related protein